MEHCTTLEHALYLHAKIERFEPEVLRERLKPGQRFRTDFQQRGAKREFSLA